MNIFSVMCILIGLAGGYVGVAIVGVWGPGLTTRIAHGMHMKENEWREIKIHLLWVLVLILLLAANFGIGYFVLYIAANLLGGTSKTAGNLWVLSFLLGATGYVLVPLGKRWLASDNRRDET